MLTLMIILLIEFLSQSSQFFKYIYMLLLDLFFLKINFVNSLYSVMCKITESGNRLPTFEYQSCHFLVVTLGNLSSKLLSSPNIKYLENKIT